MGAEWEEIDLEAHWWTIPAAKAKNGEDGKQPMRGESIGRAVRRSDEAFAKKKIKHFTPHDLRRTAATHMTEMGISRLVVSKILNHVDSNITAIYDQHSYDTEKRNALEAWGNKLRQLIEQAENTSNLVEIDSFQQKKSNTK